jgi:hypothetical protein
MHGFSLIQLRLGDEREDCNKVLQHFVGFKRPLQDFLSFYTAALYNDADA